MPVIDQKQCQNRLRKAKRPGDTNPLLGSQFKLHDSFLCAGLRYISPGPTNLHMLEHFVWIVGWVLEAKKGRKDLLKLQEK